MLKKIIKILKKLLVIFLVLVLLALLALTLFILNFDLNKYKDKAEEKLSQALQHPVSIGSIDTKLALVPTITINNFQISNNESFQDKAPLLYIKQMDAELELYSLINAQISIRKIDINVANLNLYKNQQQDNWSIPSATNSENTNSGTQKTTSKLTANKLRVDDIFLNTLNVSYNDASSQQNLVFQNIHLSHFHILDGTIVYNKQTFSISANTGSLFNLLNKIPNFPVDIKIKSKMGNLNLNGKIGNMVKISDLQATILGQTSNLKTLCNFFAIQHPMIPTKSANIKIQMTGSLAKMDIKQFNFNINSGRDLTLTANGTGTNLNNNPVLNLNTKLQLLSPNLANLWKVQPMSVVGDIQLSKTGFKTTKTTIDANRSDIKLAAEFQKVKDNAYKLALVFNSDFLNPNDIIKLQNGDTKKEEQPVADKSKSQSDFVIPYDILKATTANLNINIAHLQVGSWLGGHIGVNTQATLKDGQLKAPFKLTLLDGTLSGALNGQASKQQWELTSTASKINLNGIHALQQDLQNVVVNAKTTLDSKGATMPELLQNLSGKVVVQTNQGQIINKWFTSLPKALNLTKKKQNVSFSNTDTHIMISCAAANINIKNGVISGKDQFALETNALDVLVGGSVDLPQKTMDIVLQPTLVDNDKVNDVLSLSKFVRITGPFDKLEPKVDTQQTANALIQAGLSKIAPNLNTQSTTNNKNTICQQVLGKDALIQTEKPAQKQSKSTTQKQTTTQQKSAKKQFKEQLINTLFETLSQP